MLRKIWNKTIGKVVLSIIGLSIIAICAGIIVLSVKMVNAALQKPKEDATVIVLGCKVDKERAALMLVKRLDAAYEYLNENKEAICIVSGGQGQGEDITEAECMYRYLVEKGIDGKRIYKEGKSTSTKENLLYSKEIIKEKNLNEKVAIVTDNFHEYRAGKVAESIELDFSAVPAKTAWWMFPTYYVRELYAIVYECCI